jgi:hypothetical protein
VQIQTQAKLIKWWLIVLSFLGMFFGLLPFLTPLNFAGDFMAAGFVLFFIFIIGIITLISGIFLFKQRTWAWIVSIIMLILVIFILANDFWRWLIGNGITFFGRIFNYPYSSLEVFYASIFLIIPVVTLILLIINRKKLLSK